MNQDSAPFVKMLWLITLLTFSSGCAHAGTNSKSSTHLNTDTLIQDLCDKQVVLLGEASHGDGETLSFKVETVRKLVDECHFNTFLIESGIYDFLNFEKRLNDGGTVTPAMLSSAIGALWANQEVKPLVEFLFEKAKSGEIRLGGIDDQIGVGTYAQRILPLELTDYLSGKEKAQCLSELENYTYWKYTDHSPYDEKANSRILRCLAKVESTLLDKNELSRLHLQMIRSLKRFFYRDFPGEFPAGTDPKVFSANDRDHSMYLNFEWIRSQLPSSAKIIVWTATVHAAKDLSQIKGAQKGRVSLGSFIRKRFGKRSFALGFSAYSGSYAMKQHPVQSLSIPSPDSLEGIAFSKKESNLRYFDSKELGTFGEISARPLGYVFMDALWDQVLDGLIVFREEHPPHFFGQ